MQLPKQKWFMARRKQNTEVDTISSENMETDSSVSAIDEPSESVSVEPSPPVALMPTPASSTFVLPRDTRFVYNGGIHLLAAGTVVSEHSHDLAAMRAQGIELVAQ